MLCRASQVAAAARVSVLVAPSRAVPAQLQPLRRAFSTPAASTAEAVRPKAAGAAAASAVNPASASSAESGPRPAGFTGAAVRPMQYKPPPPELMAALNRKLAEERANPKVSTSLNALQRQARKNALLGLGIGACVIGLWLYSVWVVEDVKESFTTTDSLAIQAELEMEDRRKAATPAK